MPTTTNRIEMVIAVTYHGQAFIVHAPVETMQFADGSCCEDNNFRHAPEKPGVYQCVVYHNVTATTDYEGIEECDESFNVVSSTPIDLHRKDSK